MEGVQLRGMGGQGGGSGKREQPLGT